MKKLLFLCSSPYTIFNSINLLLDMKSKDEDILADIFIFDKTPMMRRIAKNLLESKEIFNGVLLLKDFQLSKLKIIVFSLIRIFPKFSLKILKLLSSERFQLLKYDVVVSQNFLFTIILGNIFDGAKLFLIEDGVGSYTWRASLPSARNKYLLFFNKYLFYGKLIREYVGQFVYMPQIISRDRLTPFQLPKVSDESINICKRIFSYKENMLYRNSDIIILAQGNMQAISTKNPLSIGFSRHDLLCDILNLLFVYDFQVLYRPHPTETKAENIIINHAIVDYNRNMWELECYTQITDRHILIGFETTSLTLPKILYNKEPIVMLLYHIFDYDEKEVVLLDQYYGHVKTLYNNPDKVMILKNRQDIYNAIRKAKDIILAMC